MNSENKRLSSTLIGVSHNYLLPLSLCAAFFCVLALPSFFPRSHPVAAQAYVVGYNNRVAWASLAFISILVALCSPRTRGVALSGLGRESGVSRWWLLVGMVLAAAYNGCLAWLALKSRIYGVEDFYALPQLGKYYYLHLRLYRDIEFCYGQLLFYPPIWVHWLLSRFHVSLKASYYLAVVLHHIFGVGMLYYVVNRLPMQRAMRTAAFACIVLFSFTPTLGPSYALLRYMLPIFLFVLISRIERPMAAGVAAFLGQLLAWSDSGEQAVGFGVAAAAYGCYQVWRHRNFLWSAPVLAAVAGTGLYLGSVDHHVLDSVAGISGGWGNKTPALSIEVVTLLIATVWLVPRMVVRHVGAADGGLLIGLYALGLGRLPAALGTADITHITGQSNVLFLLSVVAVSECRPLVRRAWVLAVASTYILLVARDSLEVRHRYYFDFACSEMNGAHFTSKLPGIVGVWVRSIERNHPCVPATFDEAALRSAVGDARVAAPYALPEIMEERLPQISHLVPSYWSGTIDIFDADMERRKVDELRRVEWAVLPDWPMIPVRIGPDVDTRFAIKRQLKAKHSVVYVQPLADEVNQNWVPVRRVGAAVLCRRVR